MELKVGAIFSREWKINNDLHKLAGDSGTRVDAYLPTSRGPAEPRPSRPLASPPRVGALPPSALRPPPPAPCRVCLRSACNSFSVLYYTLYQTLPNLAQLVL